MKILNTLLFVLFALSANAADGTVGTVSVQKGNNVSVNGEAPLSLTLDGKDHKSCQFLSKRAPDESHEFTWKEVTTTRGGELAEMLGDQLRSIDSLVVKGNVNDKDFHAMWDASLYGYLSVINLKNAVLENNAVPDTAFFHENEQYEGSSHEIFYYIGLRKIILPEGLEKIGEGAFYQASALRQVNFPSTLRYIGDFAFNATKLEMNQLVIPEGVEEINQYAFAFCRKLKAQVTLPSTIKKIGEWAFYGCPITSINLPEGLESLGSLAFWDCDLREVSIPSSCHEFNEGWQFGFNRNLEKMHLPEGMTEIPDHFAVDCFRLREVNFPHTLKHIGEKAFSLCISLKNVELPLGMQSLGEEAFSELEALEQIVFPASMKSLGKNSCSYWKNIKRIYCAAMEPPVCDPTDGGVFSGFDFPDGFDTPVVYIPKGTINKYKDTSRNCMGWEKFWNYVEIDPSEFPTTAIDSPAIVETQSKDNSIYDLMGRKVERPQKGNIYIQNGKKFVAK